MLRWLAAAICLGMGSPAMATLPDETPRMARETPRADLPREDVADIWLRESAPRSASGR